MLAQLRVAKLDVVDLADTRLQDPAQERLELGQVMQNSRDSPCDEVLRSKPLLQVEPARRADLAEVDHAAPPSPSED